MSIMFEPVDTTTIKRSDNVPLLTRTKAKLYEIGPVVFPTYETTTVGVRAGHDDDEGVLETMVLLRRHLRRRRAVV